MASSVSISNGGSSNSSSASSSSTSQPTKQKLPITTIPDMRFEQSFLASIRGFVHEVNEETAEEIKGERLRKAKVDDVRENENGNRKRHASPAIMATRSRTGEPELWLGRLRIEWLPLLYLTLRDQIFSPILQGAVFGVGGLAVGQLRAFLMARRRAKMGVK